jgi:hypothetical protein
MRSAHGCNSDLIVVCCPEQTLRSADLYQPGRSAGAKTRNIVAQFVDDLLGHLIREEGRENARHARGDSLLDLDEPRCDNVGELGVFVQLEVEPLH